MESLKKPTFNKHIPNYAKFLYQKENIYEKQQNCSNIKRPISNKKKKGISRSIPKKQAHTQLYFYPNKINLKNKNTTIISTEKINNVMKSTFNNNPNEINETGPVVINSTIDYLSSQLEIMTQYNNLSPNKNIIISPVSLYLSLALTVNGANGQTQSEIFKILRTENINELNELCYKIVDIIKVISNCSIASIVLSKFELLNEFINISKKYDAKVDLLVNASQVNKWCSDHTKGKIQKIVENSADLLLVLNAIYFMSDWKKPFKKINTTKQIFYSPTSQQKCDMMNNSKLKAEYKETNEYQIIRLNYTNSTNCLIILPRENIFIDDFVEGLNSNKWNEIIDEMPIEDIDFSLPKFTINNIESSFTHSLQNLGMKIPFSDSADFSKMIKGKKLKINKVCQKAYLQIDEKGTKAATVTKISFCATCARPQENKKYLMKVNRPFLFIIRSNSNKNVIIFFSKKISV